MRFTPRLFVAPGIDVIAYLLAIGPGGATPAHSGLLSFGAAVAFGYLPSLRSNPDMRSRGWSVRLTVHLAVVTLIAFCVRSGALIALTDGGEAAERPAIGIAAIVTAAIVAALILYPGYAYCAAHREWRLGSGAAWRAGAIGMVVAAAALRLFYGTRVELMPEEAYYWNYARHLDIGYLDHPPMVAWLIAAGTHLFGGGEFGVRVAPLITGAIATFFVYRLTDHLFGRASALVAVVLVQTLPFFFLAGLLITPDAPLMAAWAACLYFLERALIAGRGGAWWGAGVCLGIGLLSKYTIVLVALSAVIFVIIDPKARGWLRRPEPYAAAAVGLALFAPVIVWNARNDWASFLFQTSHRLADRPQFALHKLIGSAIVLLTPTGFAAAARALTRGVPDLDPAPGRDAGRERGWRFLQVATLTPLAVFVVFSLRHEVKLDWTGVPLIAAVPLIACGIVDGAARAASGWSAFLTGSWVPTLLVLLLIYGAGLYDLTWGIPGLGYGRHAELVPIGWRELGADIDEIAMRAFRQTGQMPVVVGMDRYAIASELAFYAPDRAAGVERTSSGHLFGQVGLMYERWFPPAAQQGRNLLLVAWNPEDLGSDRVAFAVERLGPLAEGELTRGKDVIRRYYYRLGYGYRGVGRPGSTAD